MTSPDYDLVIVGGGIHGAGVAQAAAAAGHRSLVLEKTQLAAETSSRSSKLIHGGLRYLETGQLRLVRESLRERSVLLRVAPKLVRLVPFFIPVYRETTRGSLKIRAGLSLYALLGGLRPHTRFRSLRSGDWPARDGLRRDGLRSVFRYWDAQTDDAAMTVAVMNSARSLGAETIIPGSFLSASRGDTGYRVRFQAQEKEHSCLARVLVNASGPWVHEILERITPTPPAPELELVKGAHIVVRGALEEGVYYTESPRDRRAVFVMPWGENTLVGTTETRFEGDPGNVQASTADEAYLLEVFRHTFPGFAGAGTVVSRFAGLRVLPAGRGRFARRTRETILLTDRQHSPRLVTIAGGKLTTYRSTALEVLRLLRSSLPPPHPIADTATLTLPSPEHSPPGPRRAENSSLAH